MTVCQSYDADAAGVENDMEIAAIFGAIGAVAFVMALFFSLYESMGYLSSFRFPIVGCRANTTVIWVLLLVGFAWLVG